ncbi:hypothetical protein K505DRAFT_121237 [Melanomma pulvis-pyrius CBS 109.77]|uniref:Uncharacterized protein n=1 Tax=Melanomma pulvis-pyrius CBS 109.77 TaxID=1314802 RepID=A0A6A6XQ73_9PLEO|nr:hypothetical protein K505DRAFT_121237 [Melanomma pulvis-pyrius CBS 109.77]
MGNPKVGMAIAKFSYGALTWCFVLHDAGNCSAVAMLSRRHRRPVAPRDRKQTKIAWCRSWWRCAITSAFAPRRSPLGVAGGRGPMPDPTSAAADAIHMQFDAEDGSAGLDGIGGDRSSVAWTPGELVGRKGEGTRRGTARGQPYPETCSGALERGWPAARCLP